MCDVIGDVIFEMLENEGEEMAKEISQAMDSAVNEVIFLWKFFLWND